MNVLASNNLMVIEAMAHKIKNLFTQIDADELKSSAFKIELAARRGNLKETIEYSMQFEHEFDTFKKTVS